MYICMLKSYTVTEFETTSHTPNPKNKVKQFKIKLIIERQRVEKIFVCGFEMYCYSACKCTYSPCHIIQPTVRTREKSDYNVLSGFSQQSAWSRVELEKRRNIPSPCQSAQLLTASASDRPYRQYFFSVLFSSLLCIIMMW